MNRRQVMFSIFGVKQVFRQPPQKSPLNFEISKYYQMEIFRRLVHHRSVSLSWLSEKLGVSESELITVAKSLAQIIPCEIRDVRGLFSCVELDADYRRSLIQNNLPDVTTAKLAQEYDKQHQRILEEIVETLETKEQWWKKYKKTENQE